jgi:O-antigen/teichoic acid export membrane protein
MSLLQRTSRAFIWGQIGRLAEACLFFGFSLLLARVLGPRVYGTYSLGLSTAALLGFITLLGLAPETFGRFVPDAASNGGREAVWRLLKKLLAVRSSTVIGTVVVMFLISFTGFGQLHLKFLQGTLACVLFLFAARGFYDLLVTYPGAMLELRQVALGKILAGVMAPLCFVALLLLKGSSANYALLATAAGYFFGAVWLLLPWFRRNPRSAAARGQDLELSRVLKFGLFVWMVNFFIMVLSDNADVLLVGWLLHDTALVGYYAVGARLVFRLVTLVLGWVPLIAIASVNEAYLEGGLEKMALVMQAQWRVCMLCSIAPLALLYAFAGPIIRVFYSPSYLPSAGIARILSLLMIGSAASGFALHAGILYVLNHERLACGIMGGAAIFNVLLEIYLVRKMGIDGAAWATGVSYLLLSIALAAASAIYVPLGIPWHFSLKVLTAAFSAILGTHWLDPDSLLSLVGACALWAIIFVSALAIFKPLVTADSLRLRKLNPKLGGLADRLFASRAGFEGGPVSW